MNINKNTKRTHVDQRIQEQNKMPGNFWAEILFNFLKPFLPRYLAFHDDDPSSAGHVLPLIIHTLYSA